MDVFNKVIGIDPGLSNGGIAILSKSGFATSKMPRDVHELQDLLREQSVDYEVLVFVEKVQVWGSDNKEPGKQFGIDKLTSHHAQILSSVAALEMAFCEVHPMTWQASLRLRPPRGEKWTDKIKKAKFKEAATLYSGKQQTLWSSDAVCIAEFGRRKLDGDWNWIRERIKRPKSSSTLF